MMHLLAAVLVQMQGPAATRPLGPPPPLPAAIAADTGRLRHANGRVPPVATARRVSVSPRVDGRLDDPAWAEAEPVTGLVQNEPEEGAPASERTEVRIVYDDDAIYIGARMYDHEPQLVRTELA